MNGNLIKYSDFTTSFLRHPVSDDLARINNFEAIRRSIRSLIMTDKYERLLDPKIGSNIRRILFEPMDASSAIVLRDYISETIINYEPRATLDNVQVIPDEDRNSYYVSIYFSVVFAEEVQTVEFFLDRAR